MCKLLLRRIANCYEECHFVSTEIASNLTFDLLSSELINYKRKQKKKTPATSNNNKNILLAFGIRENNTELAFLNRIFVIS